MKNKKLFSTITSWLLIILLLAGCVTAPQNDTPVSSIPGSSVSSVPSSSTPTSQPGSSATTTPATSAPASKPTTQPATQPTTQPATPPATHPATTPATPPATPPATKPDTKPDDGSFAVHFIDVGQADAALVLCDGKTMLIDGGNKADSNLIYTYLKKHNITHLDYIIGTHAHEDHIGGIPGALQIATVDTVYCPTTSYTTKAFKDFANAVTNRGASITVPNKGLTFNLGSATCTILAVNTDKKDANNSSIVMRIVYGETSFLFTGDAEREVEQAILNSGVTLKSDVLKVGHHGSETSTSYAFLREIMPQYAVISVGKDNSYGHPTDAVLSRLRDAEVTTFRTDMQGDILCVSDGKTITFTPSRNKDANVFGDIGPNSTQ